MEEERYSHESYGQISFSRVSGNANFYGSELEQDHSISMELHSSEIKRTLSRDWYHTRELLARVRMTSGQFSDMITSMNRGEGVCCTIEYLPGNKMQPLPEYENRKEFVHRKFQDRMDEFTKKLENDSKLVRELTAKKTLSKEDQRTLIFAVDKMTQEISSNIPFFAKCFQETMDEVVHEARMEIENAIQHKINTLGLESWKNEDQQKLR